VSCDETQIFRALLDRQRMIRGSQNSGSVLNNGVHGNLVHRNRKTISVVAEVFVGYIEAGLHHDDRRSYSLACTLPSRVSWERMRERWGRRASGRPTYINWLWRCRRSGSQHVGHHGL